MNTNTETTTEGAAKSHSSQSPCSALWWSEGWQRLADVVLGREYDEKSIRYRHRSDEVFTRTMNAHELAGQNTQYSYERINQEIDRLG